MSRALVFTEYGGPETLKVIDVPLVLPGPGQLRIAVRAAGVQPFDAMFRSGALRGYVPATFPSRLGNEAAGIVDAVGDGVTDFAVADEVITWGTLGGIAEHLVVPARDVARKPAGMSWPEAGAFSASGQTASTAIDVLRICAGESFLVHAAAGGVGSMAVQIARAMGATVIGTASTANHDYVRELGATPVTYVAGLVERVRAIASRVDASLVAVASDDALRAAVELVADRGRVGTTAFQPLALELGVVRISTQRSRGRLDALSAMYAEGKLRVSIAHEYSLDEAAAAHRAIETGHVRGKLVFVI
jgi:enoyl reductase